MRFHKAYKNNRGKSTFRLRNKHRLCSNRIGRGEYPVRESNKEVNKESPWVH